MNTFTSLKIGAKSDRGLVRAGNEDAFTVTPDVASGKWVLPETNDTLFTSEKGALLVIADGMGGTKGGEIAARLATEAVQSYFNGLTGIEVKVDYFKRHLEAAINFANQKIIDFIRSDASLKDMGTTICLAWIFQNYLLVSWVGDSRVYLFRQKGPLFQLTKDHSYVQELIDSGRITEAEAFSHPDKNIITQSLGDASRPPSPGFSLIQLEQSDRILLCTDGLNTMVRDYDIETILSKNDPAVYTVSDLIELANRNGGADNTTVIISDIVTLPLPADMVQMKVSTMPVSEDRMPQTSKPEIAGSNGQRTWLRLLVGCIIFVAGAIVTYQFWPVNPPPPNSAVNMEDNKTTTAENQEPRSEKKEFTDNNTYATTSQSEDIEGADLPEPNTRYNTRPRTNPRSGQANAGNDTVKQQGASGDSGTNKSDAPVQRQNVTVVSLIPGNWYLSLGSFPTKDKCEIAIGTLKATHPKVLMGVCPDGANFYALASAKGYAKKEDIPANVFRINGVGVFPVCSNK